MIARGDGDGLTWDGATPLSSVLLSYARHLPGHPAKVRVIRALASLLFGSSLPVRNAALGVTLTIDPRDYIGHAITYTRAYEPRSLALAVRLMRGGGAFVDVGANFGLYTIPLASLAGVTCYGIDASFVALTRLQANVARNGLTNVRIVTGALSRRETWVELSTPETNLGATRIVEAASSKHGREFWARAGTLQSLLEATGAPAPELLKIDVEGHELQVLEGLDWQGVFRPRHVLVEFDPDGFPGARDAAAFLADRGYTARTVEGELAAFEKTPVESNLWFADATRGSLPC